MSQFAQVGRFVLRDIEPWEGPGLFAMTGDRHVTKYMGFKVHDSVDDATRLIQSYKNSPSTFKAVCVDGSLGDMIGVVGIEISRHQAAITIMFRRDWKARGAGREFSVPFVKWVFTHPQIWRVWAFCHIENIPVQRVLERMGARREGLLHRFEIFPNISTEPQSCFIYAITR